MSLTVKVYPCGPLRENTYLVTDEHSGYKAIIDPGYYGEDVAEDIGDPNTLKYIILTHGHFDHVYAAESYVKEYPLAKLIGPEKEKYIIHKDWTTDLMSRGHNAKNCPEPDVYVNDNEILILGETDFRFIDTPGHTEGGMCVLCDDKLFSGDTLFRLSVGNTSLETGDWFELCNSIRNKLFTLNEDVIVYPGHGMTTTIGYEKRANPFV